MIYLLTAIGLPSGGSSTVQYNTVQYSTVQYSAVQYSTVQYSAIQYSTVMYSTVQYSTVQYSTVLYTFTQTVHRTTQNKQYTEQHNNLGSVRAVPCLG